MSDHFHFVMTPTNDSRKELVFGNDLDKVPSNTSFVQKCFYKDLKHLGMRQIRFHDLRHTFATNYIIAGGRIEDLKLILGHSDLKTTNRYIHLAKNYLKDKMDVVQLGPSPFGYSQFFLFRKTNSEKRYTWCQKQIRLWRKNSRQLVYRVSCIGINFAHYIRVSFFSRYPIFKKR